MSAARRLQIKRQGCLNAVLDNPGMQRVCRLHNEVEARLIRAIDKLRLSARSYHKLLKLARSIADLAQAKDIQAAHLAEAIACRRQERRNI